MRAVGYTAAINICVWESVCMPVCNLGYAANDGDSNFVDIAILFYILFIFSSLYQVINYIIIYLKQKYSFKMKCPDSYFSLDK